MKFSDVIGSIGVSILLIAFLLSLLGFIEQKSKIYAILNFTGASLSCYASVLIEYIPFVILEGTWAVVGLWAFLRAK